MHAAILSLLFVGAPPAWQPTQDFSQPAVDRVLKAMKTACSEASPKKRWIALQPHLVGQLDRSKYALAETRRGFRAKRSSRALRGAARRKVLLDWCHKDAEESGVIAPWLVGGIDLYLAFRSRADGRIVLSGVLSVGEWAHNGGNSSDTALEARRWVGRVGVRYRKRAKPAFRAGRAHHWAGRLEKAQQGYSKALSRDPMYHQARFHRAALRAAVGDLKGASNDVQRIAADPDPKALFWLERIARKPEFENLRQDKGVIDALSEVRRSEPTRLGHLVAYLRRFRYVPDRAATAARRGWRFVFASCHDPSCPDGPQGGEVPWPRCKDDGIKIKRVSGKSAPARWAAFLDGSEDCTSESPPREAWIGCTSRSPYHQFHVVFHPSGQKTRTVGVLDDFKCPDEDSGKSFWEYLESQPARP